MREMYQESPFYLREPNPVSRKRVIAPTIRGGGTMIVSGKVVRFHAIKPTLERNRYLALFHLRGFIHPTIAKRYIQGAAAGCTQGFVKCFFQVPPACLGSTAAAVQPNGLWNSRKTFFKTLYTTCCRTLYETSLTYTFHITQHNCTNVQR